MDPRTYINGSTGNEFAYLLFGNVAGVNQFSKNNMANPVNKCFDFCAQDFPASIHLKTSYVNSTTRHLNGYSTNYPHSLVFREGPYFGGYYADYEVSDSVVPEESLVT